MTILYLSLTIFTVFLMIHAQVVPNTRLYMYSDLHVIYFPVNNVTLLS